jgi:hypothetical protein
MARAGFEARGRAHNVRSAGADGAAFTPKKSACDCA